VVKDERDALAAFFKTAGFERPVFVTETGFPSGGAPHKAGSGTAKPSVAALSAFAKQVETISRDSGMGVYFFEPFDGDWKRRWQKFEAYDYTFGLYKCDRKLKKGLDLPEAKPV
jgi:exo-beta-1,3-glucanase (GH17 family)